MYQLVTILVLLYVLFLLIVLIGMQIAYAHYRHVERKIGERRPGAISIPIDVALLSPFHVKKRSGNPMFMTAIARYNSYINLFWKTIAGIIPVGLLCLVAFW